MTESLKARAVRIKRSVVSAWRQLYVDNDGDYRNTTFLAGSGRGGTTWIAELINCDNEYRFMFEPFFARHVPEVRAFRNRQYLGPGDDDPAYLDPARLVLTGKIRNAWIDGFNRRVIVKRRLVKDIRANMFLKWLDVHFPGMPIVLLLRHPFAVASSRSYHAWSHDLADFLRQDALMADHLEPHRRLLETTNDPFEQHVLQWCIENWIPLRQFRRGEIHLAYYEHFSVEPRAAIEQLFAVLGQPVTAKAIEGVERPSRMTWAGPSGRTPRKSDPDAWRPHVSRDQLKRSLDILARFGLDAVYGSASLPNPDAAQALLQPPAMGLKAHVRPAQ